MARIINGSIDLSKINKSKIKDGKNGQKYYDISITVNDTPNEYGQDVSIAQSQTKEEREAKEKKIYLGNGKTVWKNEPVAAPEKETNHEVPADYKEPYAKDDLPF